MRARAAETGVGEDGEGAAATAAKTGTSGGGSTATCGPTAFFRTISVVAGAPPRPLPIDAPAHAAAATSTNGGGGGGVSIFLSRSAPRASAFSASARSASTVDRWPRPRRRDTASTVRGGAATSRRVRRRRAGPACCRGGRQRRGAAVLRTARLARSQASWPCARGRVRRCARLCPHRVSLAQVLGLLSLGCPLKLASPTLPPLAPVCNLVRGASLGRCACNCSFSKVAEAL
mmetsp:Transcript_15710/g.48635  ORF Transcript_15710/g.48635 Transcript_15710/m.48635 type:complete len:232 (+) Transcript_15710:951-1646(+)